MATEKLRKFASAAAAAAVNIARPNYFESSKRGEIYELRSELNSEIELVKKEAVKKVIASMTVGKDVSNLFADVLKCIQTDDIELKKLVYLYLMNYATSQPDLVILAINTFCKDTEHPNPLVRALAVRTMGCLRVERIMDYLCEPLRKTLSDSDPYVRKTAAICTAKVIELSPELAEENGFIEILQSMLADSNATVISSVVAALADAQQRLPSVDIFRVDARLANRLLGVINDCTEWGQIVMLEALAGYKPADLREAENALEKVAPRLQHASPAVVMAAVKLIVAYLELIPSTSDLHATLLKRLTPPLVSLMSGAAEIQYVALKNINLILQRYPEALPKGARVFFCKFTDPLYVKLEKLEIILQLVDEANYEAILSELDEYAREVEAEFARKSIMLMALCALKVPAATHKALEVLYAHVTSRNDFAMQQAVVALQLLLRRYPGENVEFLASLLPQSDQEEGRLQSFEEPEAKAALIWLLGEYGHMTLRGEDALLSLSEAFALESTQVQHELLSAALKLYLREPTKHSSLIRRLVKAGMANRESMNLRDRSFIYSKVLDAELTIVQQYFGERLDLDAPHLIYLDKALLSTLLQQLGLISSVYHKSSEQFLAATRHPHMSLPGESKSVEAELDLLDLNDGENSENVGACKTASSPQPLGSEKPSLLDLLTE